MGRAWCEAARSRRNLEEAGEDSRGFRESSSCCRLDFDLQTRDL